MGAIPTSYRIGAAVKIDHYGQVLTLGGMNPLVEEITRNQSMNI